MTESDKFREVSGESIEKILLSEGLEMVAIDDHSIIAVAAPRVFNEGHNRSVQLESSVDAIEYSPYELGRSNTIYSNYDRAEYNPEFRGRQGLIRYDKMRRDAAVRAALKVFKTPINGATWFVEPGEDTKKAKTIATFVENTLTQYMTYSWPMILREALLMVDYGYYFFEKVYQEVQFNGKTLLTYRKLAARHPLDVIEFGWQFDRNGGPIGVDMYDYPGGQDHVFIPINKIALFTYDGEAGNVYGDSILRSAYKHWFFKEQAYKIDAIQKERHGIGIPIIKLPQNASSTQIKAATDMGRNLRSNEKAHIVLPYGWEVVFAKLEGNPVNALDTAMHHSNMIYQNVLAGSLLGSEGGKNSAEAMLDIFYKSSRDLANLVREVVNMYVIPDIVNANWDVEYYPKISVRRLGDTTEARTISFAIRNLIGAGVLRVDDQLEAWSRSLMDAPMFDPDSYRPAPAPQAPGGNAGGPGDPSNSVGPPEVGPPRQAPADKTKQGKTSGTATNGRDGGGTGGGQ